MQARLFSACIGQVVSVKQFQKLLELMLAVSNVIFLSPVHETLAVVAQDQGFFGGVMESISRLRARVYIIM